MCLISWRPCRTILVTDISVQTDTLSLTEALVQTDRLSLVEAVVQTDTHSLVEAVVQTDALEETQTEAPQTVDALVESTASPQDEHTRYRATQFTETDANGDGRITASEFASHHERRLRARPHAAHWRMFWRMDRNRDGVVDRDEFLRV